MKKKNKRLKSIPFVPHSGEYMEINYDEKVEKLNVQFGEKLSIPVVRFEDWTTEGKEKKFFDLHIGEALELKAIIDKSVLDYVWAKIDELDTKIKNLDICEHKIRRKDCKECCLIE